MAIKHSDILRIVDIHVKQLSPETFAYIDRQDMTYQDQKLNEHIYNISDMVEEGLEIDSEIVIKEMEQMSRLCTKHNAGYIRIIHS